MRALVGDRNMDAETLLPSIELAMVHIIIGSAWLFLEYEKSRKNLEKCLVLEYEIGNAVHIANLYAYLGAVCGELYQFTSAECYLSRGSIMCLTAAWISS